MSAYLDLPNRSEAEVIIDRVEALRAKVAGVEKFAREELTKLGVSQSDLSWLNLLDCFNDAACSIEKPAKEAIEQAELHEELAHIDSERRALAWRI